MSGCGAGRSIGEGEDPALSGDAKILHETLREAIDTSPGSFLKTLEDIDGTDWLGEIQSSTWVVAQHDGGVVGIAVAKRPDPDKDREDYETSRYIESVWIAPEHRRRRLGERLINYLLETEYQKNQQVEQFLLWVFVTNLYAIRMYEHMGFDRTSEMHKGVRTERKYKLDFTSEVYTAVRKAVKEAAHRRDGVTYRVLGSKDST
jgi:ribosomal protein S18 acetylase RimI-like enzyme